MSATNVKIGDEFGRLRIVSKTNERAKNGSVYWNCICSCGNDVFVKVISSQLKNGHTKSCGCLKRELDSLKIKYINDNNLKRYVIKLNEYETDGDITYILLNDNKKAIIDTSLLEKISNYTWTKYTNGYCYNVKSGILLHRFIMDVTDQTILVDHINHNKLDNRRENLRLATRQQNSFNSKPINGKTKGIYQDSNSGKWVSQICVNGKMKHLGKFYDKNDAILARVEEEKKSQGEYRYEWEKELNETN